MKRISKTETEKWLAQIECARALERIWTPGKQYAAAEYVRPSVPNGFEYECTTAGQSTSSEPSWPRSLGATKTDGSIVWTARAFAANATDSISSVNIVAPAGITVGSPTVDGSEVEFLIEAGSKNETYTLSVEITTAAGELIEEKIEVFIKDE